VAIAGADRVSSRLFLSSDTAKLFEMYGKLAKVQQKSFFLSASCLVSEANRAVVCGNRGKAFAMHTTGK